MARPLYEIAREIRKAWTKIPQYSKSYIAAMPYLEAMESLNTIDDNYYFDSGEEIVLKFLNNANTWRGEDARRIKAELKEMFK